jgi:hypothetical protein
MTRSRFALLIVMLAVAALLFLAASCDRPADVVERNTAIESSPRGYVCYRATTPIVIDGKLNDMAWQSAPWTQLFRDIEGDRQPEPPLATRVKMLWDHAALYIAAELEEPHIWATLRMHDSVIFHDNDFEVFLDPDSDSHLYGELELNALNTTWDLLLSKPYRDSGSAVNAWEITGLTTAVQIDGTLNDARDRDRGWTVEIAWPWQSIKELTRRPVPPRHDDQWRINFSRVEWDFEIVGNEYRKIPNRKEHNWVWSPQGAIDMHRPERWGLLQFSTATPGATELRPDPAQAARDYLYRVYYAAWEYRKRHGRFADSLAAIGISRMGGSSGLSAPTLQVTSNGFEASIVLSRPDGVAERWRITHESRIVRD